MHAINIKPDENGKHLVKFVFADGCEFSLHGGSYEKGWQVQFESAKITCPHGKTARIGGPVKPTIGEVKEVKPITR